MKPDLRPYGQWLVEQGYQPSTITVTLRHLRAVWKKPREAMQHVSHVQRYLRFVAETKKHPLGFDFTRSMRKKGLKPASEIRKQGRRERSLLNDEQWRELRSTLRGGDDTDKLLLAYMESPYRVGEFLQMKVSDVTEETVIDKRSRDWIQDGNGERRQLYQLLCPTPRCTYYRLRKRLLDLSKSLGIDVDLDTLYKSFHELREAA